MEHGSGRIWPFTSLLGSCWKENPIPIYGNGSGCRGYTSIDDLIRDIRVVMEYKEVRFFEVVKELKKPVGV